MIDVKKPEATGCSGIYLIREERTFDPHENLRRECGYFHSTRFPAARVWRSGESVVLGRFQEAFREVHLDRAASCRVPVLRRPSGGGAVFHDLGNINYSFYLSAEDLRSWRVEECLRELSYPVTLLLDGLGVRWRWVPPNNIFVGGRKISGSAQARHAGRFLHHGTLLVNTDLEKMRRLLKDGGSSVVSPVANLNELVPGIRLNNVETLLTETLMAGPA